MTRALPRSELQLTRVQVRDLVACPRCGSIAGLKCRTIDRHAGDRDGRMSGNHAARVAAARAILRARRLE